MEHIKQDQIINIPNALTVVRILLLPVVVWRFVIGDATGALIAYLAAMLTDALDGIIARKFNQITALGKLLDPLADKLSLVTLLGLFVSDGQIPLWVLAIILVKEVTMVIGGGVAQVATTLYLAVRDLDGVDVDDFDTYGSRFKTEAAAVFCFLRWNRGY